MFHLSAISSAASPQACRLVGCEELLAWMAPSSRWKPDGPSLIHHRLFASICPDPSILEPLGRRISQCGLLTQGLMLPLMKPDCYQENASKHLDHGLEMIGQHRLNPCRNALTSSWTSWGSSSPAPARALAASSSASHAQSSWNSCGSVRTRRNGRVVCCHVNMFGHV